MVYSIRGEGNVVEAWMVRFIPISGGWIVPIRKKITWRITRTIPHVIKIGIGDQVLTMSLDVYEKIKD